MYLLESFITGENRGTRMTVRLTTLGHPSVSLHGEELTSLPGKPVTFGLFVFLAVEREATRDHLVSVFWPESSQEKARHALSQTLYELRQALGEDWIESSGNSLRTTPSLWVDSQEFLERVETERNQEAVELYAGPFLVGFHLAPTHSFEEWVERKRARLARRHRVAIDAFIRECQERGDLEQALQNAWRWVGLDPLDDGGQQHLIQLLALTGSRAQALAQYDRYESLLEAELGLTPLEETVELVNAIRSGTIKTPSKAAPLPEGLPTEPVVERVGNPATLRDLMDSELSPSLEVLRPISQGAMAEVFLAREPLLKRLVAVKVLSPALYSDTRARKRFEREAQAAARIDHPHVCTVHRVGSLSDGTPFLVSPFVKGATLEQRLKAEGRLGSGEVRRVLKEVASALAAAHKIGILHRDVRPDNILRAEESGRHSLCDFGLSGILETGADLPEPRLTRTGEVLGSPAYISPEQLEGEPLTDRSDVYSLGILAHQLLTGHPPPPVGEPGGSAGRRDTGVDLGPLAEYLGETDRGLVELIEQCLAADPSHRPRAADIEGRLSGERRVPETRRLERITKTSLVSLVFQKRLPQILGAYVAGGWIVYEAALALEERKEISWHWPLVEVSLLFGFLTASVFGWFHGEKGQQRVPRVEKWLLGVIAAGWLAAMIWELGKLLGYIDPS